VNAHVLQPPMLQYVAPHSETEKQLPKAVVFEAKPGNWNAGKTAFLQPGKLRGCAILDLTPQPKRNNIIRLVRPRMHSCQ
jgi:hypothetical protein